MEIRIISRGETRFTADSRWQEPDIRAAIAEGGGIATAVALAAREEREDMERGEWASVTEDDGTALWSGWLDGAGADIPAPDAELEQTRGQLAVTVEALRALLPAGQGSSYAGDIARAALEKIGGASPAAAGGEVSSMRFTGKDVQEQVFHGEGKRGQYGQGNGKSEFGESGGPQESPSVRDAYDEHMKNGGR